MGVYTAVYRLVTVHTALSTMAFGPRRTVRKGGEEERRSKQALCCFLRHILG